VGLALLLFTGLLPVCTFAAEPAAHSTNSAEVTFEVKLEISGDIPDKDEPFTFLLRADDDEPLPSDQDIVINGAGAEVFETILFTKPGRYVYTISQENDGKANYKYDDTFYTVIVTVSYNSSGKLEAVYTATGASMDAPFGVAEGKASEILFINEYGLPDSAAPSTDETEPAPDETGAPVDTDTPPETDIPPAVVTEIPEETKPTAQTEAVTEAETVPEGETVPETEAAKKGFLFSGAPQTGEDSIILLWTVLMYIGLVGIVVCIKRMGARRKKDNEKNKS
jgi:pilin isopeptide linkage protein